MSAYVLRTDAGERPLTPAEDLAVRRHQAAERCWSAQDARAGRRPTAAEREARRELNRLDDELRRTVGLEGIDQLQAWLRENLRHRRIHEIHREGAEPLTRPTPAHATPDAEPGTANAGTTARAGHAAEGRPDVGAARAACSEVRSGGQRQGTGRGSGEPSSRGPFPASTPAQRSA